jgi:hypothetical protein
MQLHLWKETQKCWLISLVCVKWENLTFCRFFFVREALFKTSCFSASLMLFWFIICHTLAVSPTAKWDVMSWWIPNAQFIYLCQFCWRTEIQIYLCQVVKNISLWFWFLYHILNNIFWLVNSFVIYIIFVIYITIITLLYSYTAICEIILDRLRICKAAFLKMPRSQLCWWSCEWILPSTTSYLAHSNNSKSSSHQHTT